MERTIAAREGAAPLEVGLALQGLGVAERVARLAAERHQGAHVEVVALPLAVDGNAGIHAVIRLQLQGLRNTSNTQHPTTQSTPASCAPKKRKGSRRSEEMLKEHFALQKAPDKLFTKTPTPRPPTFFFFFQRR